MEPLKGFFGSALGSGFGLLALGAVVLANVGGIYWLWLAIKLGSFGMFILGVIPPAWIITAPVGAWSLLFGPPYWVLRMFGQSRTDHRERPRIFSRNF